MPVSIWVEVAWAVFPFALVLFVIFRDPPRDEDGKHLRSRCFSCLTSRFCAIYHTQVAEDSLRKQQQHLDSYIREHVDELADSLKSTGEAYVVDYWGNRHRLVLRDGKILFEEKVKENGLMWYV